MTADHDRDGCDTARFRHWLSRKVEALNEEARGVIDAYWSAVIAEERGRPYSERTQLAVRSRIHRGSLHIEWMRVYFRWDASRGKKSSKPSYQTLAKGTRPKYRDATLRRFSRGWDWPLIQETEDALAKLRFKATKIGRVRRALTGLEKLFVMDT